MKNFILYIILPAIAMFALIQSCTKMPGAREEKTMNTRVEYINPLNTKAGDWRDPVDGKFKVYYYIRIDGNIPGEDEVNLPARDYFPQTSARKSAVTALNSGYVTAFADWRSCSKFQKYIYSKDGSSVESLILEQPTLEDLVNADKGPGNDFTGFLQHKDELHFLWYVCKRQDADKCWHIDGILTSKTRTNIMETIYGEEIAENYKTMVDDEGSVVKTGGVEVDIHQQLHTDWNEIKTSIHIRDTVNCQIVLPLPLEIQAQVDDFSIRSGFVYESIKKSITIGEKTFDVHFDVAHEERGVVITISAADKELLKAAREAYMDGITFEIHSYVKQETERDAIWNYIKSSKLRTSFSDTFTDVQVTNVKGQITNYFSEDKVLIQ